MRHFLIGLKPLLRLTELNLTDRESGYRRRQLILRLPLLNQKAEQLAAPDLCGWRYY